MCVCVKLNKGQGRVLNMKPHPINPNILLTGAMNGLVVQWDLNTGERIFEEINQVNFELRRVK